MTADRLRRAAPFALYAAIAAWYCAPLFTNPDALGVLDWDQNFFYYASVIKSVAEYGQFPFWNPWYCGGNVLWQNPQIPLLSPALPLALIVSLPLAMKLTIVLHYWVGLVGMHLLVTRSLGVRDGAVAYALSCVATLSGAMAMHLAVGHSVFLPVFYLPLQLHCVIQAIRTGAVRHVTGAAILLALMVWNGALHAVPMSVAAIAVLCLAAAAAQRRWRPLLAGVLVGLLGFAFAAPKLLPVTLFVTGERFTDVRTVITHPDATSLEMLARAYLDRYQHRGLKFDNQRSGWYEYGNYVGGVGVGAMAGGLLVAFCLPGTRERWLGLSLASTALVFLLLSAGEFGALAPASLARSVPLFSSFRIPSRYTFGFVLCGLAAVGWAWRATIGDGPLTRGARVMMWAVSLAAVADVALQTRVQFLGVFTQAPLQRGFRIGGGAGTAPVVDTESNAYRSGSPMLNGLMDDRNFWRCYESLQLARTASPTAPLVSADGAARISDVRFSPNRIDFALVAGRDTTTLRLNQNASPGWESSAGTPVPADGAGMAVALAPGQAGRYYFRFIPQGLWTGLALAATGIVGAVVARRRTLPDR